MSNRRRRLLTQQFDDIRTNKAWGDIPSNYKLLHFAGFYAFKPNDSALEDLISLEDLNCAVSAPNALYGTRQNLQLLQRSNRGSSESSLPTITLYESASAPKSFQLHSVKVKPLSMPLGHAKLVLNGTKINGDVVVWSVDFPAGYNEMFEVNIARFSNESWTDLRSLSIFADFHYSGIVEDWEFCLDDLEVALNA